MKHRVNRMLKALWLFHWCSILLWRQILGRWFYLRDAPIQVVILLSWLDEDATTDNQHVRWLCQDARKELELRSESRRRKWMSNCHSDSSAIDGVAS